MLFCSDSKPVISLASSDLDPPWEIAAIIGDIKSYSSRFGCNFLFIPKALNFPAHWIARAVVRDVLLRDRAFVPPAPVRSFLNKLC